METENGKDLGLWVLEPVVGGLMIHVRMGEGCRGRRAVESAKNAFKWVFGNTGFDRIYAVIPNDRRAAQFMASWAGMRSLGPIENARKYVIERTRSV